LVGMPVRFDHYADHILYIRVWNFRLEEIAHAIDKDRAWARPLERLRQFFRHSAEIKALFIGMPGDAAETLGKGFGIAVLAARTDLGASPQWIPGCVSPLDFRMFAHGWTLADRFT